MNEPIPYLDYFDKLILEKLYKMWNDDWEEIALDFLCERGKVLNPEQCQYIIYQLNLPARTIHSSRISKDDFDYCSNLREGLGLSFFLDTKKAVIYHSCKNTERKYKYCHDSSNCITYDKGKYRVCIHALFVCANSAYACPRHGKFITAYDDFDIDHIISFKNYWARLQRVDIEEVKRWYNNVENLQIMCPHCNRSLGGK